MENDFTIDNELTPEIETKLQTIIADVNGIIDGCLTDHGFENLTDITQQQFTGVLHYVGINYFKPTKCLYKYAPGVSHNGQKTKMYNDDLLYGICQYYIYICTVNNKVVNPFGFSAFIHCDYDLMNTWVQMKNERPQAYRVAKTLREYYQTSLENGAQSGKNPVGFIATLNHRFGWSADNKPTLTVNITRSKNEILSTYNQNLIDETSENGAD